MLLSFELGDGLPVFCKLKRLSDIETLDGNELKVVQIGKKWKKQQKRKRKRKKQRKQKNVNLR